MSSFYRNLLSGTLDHWVILDIVCVSRLSLVVKVVSAAQHPWSVAAGTFAGPRVRSCVPTISMPPSLAPLVALARKQKGVAVKNPHTNGEVLHFIDFERDGVRVIRAGWRQPDEILACMRVGVPLLAADAVIIAADSYCSTGTGERATVNPITGKQWKLGDMDEIAHNDLAVERGLIAEGISVMRFERRGGWVAGTLPYTHDRNRRRLRWGQASYYYGTESDRLAEELDMQARFPALAREAFEHQVAASLYAEVGGDMVVRTDGLQHGFDLEMVRQIDEQDGVVLEAPL